MPPERSVSLGVTIPYLSATSHSKAFCRHLACHPPKHSSAFLTNTPQHPPKREGSAPPLLCLWLSALTSSGPCYSSSRDGEPEVQGAAPSRHSGQLLHTCAISPPPRLQGRQHGDTEATQLCRAEQGPGLRAHSTMMDLMFEEENNPLLRRWPWPCAPWGYRGSCGDAQVLAEVPQKTGGCAGAAAAGARAAGRAASLLFWSGRDHARSPSPFWNLQF